MKIHKPFNGPSYHRDFNKSGSFYSELKDFFVNLKFDIEIPEEKNQHIWWDLRFKINNIQFPSKINENSISFFVNDYDKVKGGRVQITFDKDYNDKELINLKQKIKELIQKRSDYLKRQDEKYNLMNKMKELSTKLMENLRGHHVHQDYHSLLLLNINDKSRNYSIKLNPDTKEYNININTYQISCKNSIELYEKSMLAEIERVRSLHREAEEIAKKAIELL